MDPFDEVKRETQESLESAHDLVASYLRIKSTIPTSSHSTSEELLWAKDELDNTLAAIETDADDLQHSLDVVTRAGVGQFGLSMTDLEGRRNFVSTVRSQVKEIKDEMIGRRTKSPYDDASRLEAGYREDEEQEDDLDEFEMQQQTYMMDQQDTALESIGKVVGTLKQQASTIGSEVVEQVGMLTSLTQNVDGTQSKLNKAQKKLDGFIQANKNSRTSWCILILIVVLTILLLALAIV